LSDLKMTANLQLAIQTIKDKDYDYGRKLLEEIIEENPDNENAWLWMSQVMQTDQERYDCLTQVLRINPNNKYAQRGVDLLDIRGFKPANKSDLPFLETSIVRIKPNEETEEAASNQILQDEEALLTYRAGIQAEEKRYDKKLGEPISKSTTAEDRYFWNFFVLIGITILLCALVVMGNTPLISAWLLALLAIGIGQGLMLPSPISFLVGFVTVFLWVLFRQITGVWSQQEFVQGLLEIFGLSVSIFLAIRIRQVWKHQNEELQELRGLRQVLVEGEVGTGLLPYEVANLRLLEEIDRAKMFKRPLGLLIIEIEALPKLDEVNVDFHDIYQALTRQLTSISLVHDIPFRSTADKVGLIMPERNWNDLYHDTDLIANSLRSAKFIQKDGSMQETHEFIKLNFGLGTYQGEAGGQIDIVRAAEDSLNITRELSEIGEAPVSAHAMPAIQIVESDLTLSEEQE